MKAVHALNRLSSQPRSSGNYSVRSLRFLVLPLSIYALGQWLLFDIQTATFPPSAIPRGDEPWESSDSGDTNNANVYVNTIDISNKKATLLSPEGRSKDHLFVHIGKAGGSSIQEMVKKSRKKCEELTTQEREKGAFKAGSEDKLDKDQVCALSTIPDGRVHLKSRLNPKKHYAPYTQFLINLRDPIDRLYSWYNYEVASFKKEPRWSTANETGQASDNFKRLTQDCYPGDQNENGFVKMVHGGLMLSSNSSSPSSSFDAHEEVEVGVRVNDCDQLARFCLRGDIMCFGHNYYNYEVYLEEILRRMGFSADGKHPAEGHPTIRVDAIRSEHSMDDFNTTVGLWTSPTLEDYQNTYPGVTPFVQSLYGRVRSIEGYLGQFGKKKKKKKPSSTPPPAESKPHVLSPQARTALCRHICSELVVYKLALRAADNLDAGDVRESYDALDLQCGMDVDAVCGTTWTFRDVKTKKKIFSEAAPW